MALQYGNTALSNAVRGDHKDTVQLLLDRGADVDGKDRVSRAGRMPFGGWAARGWSGQSVDCDLRSGLRHGRLDAAQRRAGGRAHLMTRWGGFDR